MSALNSLYPSVSEKADDFAALKITPEPLPLVSPNPTITLKLLNRALLADETQIEI